MVDPIQGYPIRTGFGAEQAGVDLSNSLNLWLRNSGPNGLFRTCGSCRRMAQTGPAFCGLYNMTPPIAVIMTGCDSHEDEAEVPFPA